MTQKTSKLKIRNRQFGDGVSREDLLADLLEAANLLFDSRGETRPVQTSITDAVEGYIARIGPLSCMPDPIIAKAKAVAKLYQEWDRATGDLAGALEVLARDVKRAPEDPGCSRYDKKAYSYNRRSNT